MEDIAREAGVARTVLYRYFSSRDDLQLAVIVRHIDRRAAEVHSRIPRRGSSRALIMRVLLEGLGGTSDAETVSVLGPDVVHRTASLISESPEVAAAMSRYWEPFLRYAARRGELRTDREIDEIVRWLTMIVFLFLTLPEVVPSGVQLPRYLEHYVVDAIVVDAARIR